MDSREFASSIAEQDQEWAEALRWYQESDTENVSAMAMLSVADDPQALTQWMADDNDAATIVQRMVALVLVELAQRAIQSREDR